MAITRTQQAKQMLQEGGRTGFFTAGLAQGDKISPGTSSTKGRKTDEGPRSRIQNEKQEEFRKNQLKELIERQQEEKAFEPFESLIVRKSNFPGLIGIGLNALKGPRQNLLNRNIDFFRNDPRTRKAREKYGLTAQGYKNYMSARLAGEIDAAGNRIMGGDDDNNNFIPVDTTFNMASNNMDQESQIEEDEGLFRRFRANGGPAGGASAGGNYGGNRNPEQEYGGSIFSGGPNQSGPPTNVGGGGKPEGSPVFDNFSRIAEIEREKRLDAFMKKIELENAMKEEDEDTNAIDTVFSEKPAANLQKVFGTGLQERKDIYDRILEADGGRAELAGGGMPYEGGIMDLESARQMYGLGKLVKKITRSVKKIAKSPIGKAALLYTVGGGLGSVAQGGTFFGNFASPMNQLRGVGSIFSKGGLENIMSKAKLGKFVADGADGFSFQKNFLGKALTSPSALIAGASAVSGLLTAEQEEEAQMISDQTGIDIAEIRANPDKYLGRRFRAEGGSMEGKEPVAKKVMPLLDMDGKEKDYRETGGFVDMGRMEKADDVPARLSKNEFVFTADAVRNAGDGSVDKGAEVMYNMMKNLESGGDVSEESQGLEGARKMFQTSQRLEEVL